MTLNWPAGWPRTPEGKRVRGNFSYQGQAEGYSWTVKRGITRAMATRRVQDEVARMGGTGLVIETDEDLRLDGSPRSNQRRDQDQGVVVKFRLPGGRAIVMPCDRYTQREQNLAAIAATIQAKRAIERHGVGSMEREFEGYAALPASVPTKRPPHEVLGVAPDAPQEVVRAAYKALALKHHPDRGGDPAAFHEIRQAMDDLEARA